MVATLRESLELYLGLTDGLHTAVIGLNTTSEATTNACCSYGIGAPSMSPQIIGIRVGTVGSLNGFRRNPQFPHFLKTCNAIGLDMPLHFDSPCSRQGETIRCSGKAATA